MELVLNKYNTYMSSHISDHHRRNLLVKRSKPINISLHPASSSKPTPRAFEEVSLNRDYIGQRSYQPGSLG